MVTGCGKRLNHAGPQEWGYIWTKEAQFTVGNCVFAEHGAYPNYPCGSLQEWRDRTYIPLCIRCAQKNGFIW